ncbi:MAG: hypothetical protein LBI77_00845 [Puniceicoccales bacterium]|jgi:hypothetical protein|nr:hypothetical protein [Puniceicoccales bacterium]
MENSKREEEERQKKREEKLAELLAMHSKNISKIECPLREFVKKSFAERVLWLEDRTKSQLTSIVNQCENCNKCKREIHPKSKGCFRKLFFFLK